MRVGFFIVLSLALGSSRASADPARGEEVDRANALFQEGRALMDRGQLGEACPKLEQSFQLAPRLGTMLNLGACFERSGQLVRALAIYERAAMMAQEAGRADRERAARELAAAVEPRVARVLLVIEDPSPDLTIVADGEVVTTRGGLVPLDPGQRRIRAAAAGKIPFETTVTAHAGETLRVTVPRLRFEETAGAPAPPAEAPTQPVHRSAWRPVGIVVGLSLAVGGAVVGTIFGARAWSKRNESNALCDASGCDPQGVDLIDQARTAGNVSTVAFVGAGAGLACAATFFFLSRVPAASSVSLAVGPRAAAIRGSF